MDPSALSCPLSDQSFAPQALAAKSTEAAAADVDAGSDCGTLATTAHKRRPSSTSAIAAAARKRLRRARPSAAFAEALATQALPEPSSPSSERQPLWAIAALELEVEDLRRDPPSYVSWIGHLKVPAVVCEYTDDARWVVRKPVGQGPWDLVIVVSGSEKNQAYDYPFKVCLRFDRDWPSAPPRVRFQCVIHHALTDERNGMPRPFYHRLLKEMRRGGSLRCIVRAVHDFLVDPLSGFELPKGVDLADALDSILSAADLNAGRVGTILRYRLKALHRELLISRSSQWREEWLDSSFLEASRRRCPEAWREVLTEILPGRVFSLKLLSKKFCDTLVEEILHFYASGLPVRRPNNMNRYGLVLNDIGLEPLIDELQRLMQPLGELLWPEGPGQAWDGHHCFVVRYCEGQDLGLDMHVDDSDVTVNVCLGLEFGGAGLQFCGELGAPDHRKQQCTYMHEKGRCVIHLGRQRHGADDITSGERLNLILWNHSSTYRQSDEYRRPVYKAEAAQPDAICLSYTHDRDYGVFKEYPAGKESMEGKAWCPPRRLEYPGFRAGPQSS